MSNIIKEIQFVHSRQVSNDNTNSFIIKQNELTIDTTSNKIIHIEPQLKTYNDPTRSIYITNERYRNHKYKKTEEWVNRCDMFKVRDSEVTKKCIDLLKIENMYGRYINPKKVFDNPFIYNADISMECLIRTKLDNRRTSTLIDISSGFFDIEADVTDTGAICVASIMCGTNVYTAVLDNYLYKRVDGKRVKATKKDILRYLEEDQKSQVCRNIIREHKLNLVIEIFSNEIDLITWLINKPYEHKTDFMGIWNLGFDIPYVLERLAVHKVSPESVFCDKTLAPHLQLFKYKPDNKENVQHISEKWNWLTCSSGTQWYDALGLYARVRKQQSKEPSYSLDAITDKELNIGKMKTSSSSHYIMQQEHFLEYTIYNIMDILLLYLMEKKNRDLYAWTTLTGNSPLKDFAFQTTMLKNDYSRFCLENGRVYATSGSNMSGPYDDKLLRTGGAVLINRLAREVGMHCIEELISHESMLIPMCADVDFSAMYPSFLSAFGLAKENKISTIVGIEGHARHKVEEFCGLAPDVMENSVQLGVEFFNLPGYEEMEQLVINEIFNNDRAA